MADPTVGDAIDAAASQYGLNPAVLKGIAQIESSWNPGSNRNRPDTQYKGLFQIGNNEWKQHGSGDIYNAADNANAAAKMLSGHAQWFQDNYGREPTPGELYMMHLQGRGFISKGIMTNVAGNPYPGMSGPQTPETFAQGWSNTLARKMAPFGSGGVYGAGGPPTLPAGASKVAAGLDPTVANVSPEGTEEPAPAAASAAVASAAPAVPKAVVNAQKLVDADKQAESDKQSKGMMALAQQLLAASASSPSPGGALAAFSPQQAPAFRPMQLSPFPDPKVIAAQRALANAQDPTAPLRALPLDIPKFGQQS
jgi:hypothetical protein